MTPYQRKKLDEASTVGRSVWFKNKQTRGQTLWGTVVDEVFIIVGEDTDDPYKHMIQKIRPAKATFEDEKAWDGSAYFYRTGYYTFKAENKEHLIWGQYTQCLTETEYKELLRKAREKGWNIV